ncbi:MAG: DMT family transporter [Deinococcota bacterium]
MTLFALGLVVAAAFAHASWNLFAKKVGGGAAFVWLFGALSACIYAPLALGVIFIQKPTISPLGFVFILGSGVLHLAYFLLLQRGYKVGDLSLVYPLARGTGPMLSTVLAIIIFTERPSPLALCGAALVIVSVFLLAGGRRLLHRTLSPQGKTAIMFGLLTGVLIASYTLWDKHAVSVLLIPPLVFDWSMNVVRVILLAPVALKNWTDVTHHWQHHRREALLVATLSSLAYILVLTALTFSPVSYIAPAREISILIGAVMGATFLKEGDVKRRLAAASLMVLGVIALAFG